MDLFTKAKERGIQTEFIDGQGHRHVTDAAALTIILDALPAELPHRLLDGPVVIRSGQPSRTGLKAATFPLRWKIASAGKVIAEGETREPVMVWPANLPEGAYRLYLTDATSVTISDTWQVCTGTACTNIAGAVFIATCF